MSVDGPGDSSGTILHYEIKPSSVFVGTTSDLTLVITNPLEKETTVTLEPGPQGDLISVTFTGSKAITDDFNFSSQSETAGFAAGSQSAGSGVFNIQPTAVRRLTPGQSIKVLFSGIVINGQTGPAQVQIEEFIGDSDQNTTLSVERVAQELRVISWVDPAIIGLGQTTTLRWLSFGGVRVKVAGFIDGTGEKTFNVRGDPPHPDSTQVGVGPNEGFRTYTLTVYTGDGQHEKDATTVYQQSPVITSFECDPPSPGPVKADQKVQLSWDSLYGQYAFLQTPVTTLPVDVSPSSPTTVTPGADAYEWSGGGTIPPDVTYQLQVAGYQPQATKEVNYQISPVKIVYFKFANMDATTGKLSGLVSKFDPPGWPAVNISNLGGGISKLVVGQPGGKETVWWLGDADTTHPQVQFFDAVAGSGGKYTLRWVTANLKTLTLSWNDGSPQSYVVPAGQLVKGTYEVTPKGATDYLLTAVGNNAEVVTSTLSAGGPA
jgi:hypothetical protein